MGTKDEISKKKYCDYIQASLHCAETFDDKKITLLAKLAGNEIDFLGDKADEIINTGKKQDELKNLVKLAKELRLMGEYPYYIAIVIAVWFAAQKGEIEKFISSNDINASVRKYCGIEYERELIQMIEQSFGGLPNLGIDNEQKIDLMKEACRKGDYYEKVYRGCAQCHMAAVSDITGKEDLVMFRAANGLAAGMGLMGDGVCGGYSGGILMLGQYAGRRKEFFDGDKDEKTLITKLVGKLHEKYIATYGSVICHDIHKDIFGRAFHITKADDKIAFEEAGAHSKDKCPAVVGTSAAWVTEILYDEGFLTEETKNIAGGHQ